MKCTASVDQLLDMCVNGTCADGRLNTRAEISRKWKRFVGYLKLVIGGDLLETNPSVKRDEFFYRRKLLPMKFITKVSNGVVRV